MEDEGIVALYWERSQDAVTESQLKYGRYCRTIAARILPTHQDAEEAENDTWLKAWNTIPPQRPIPLAPYLGMLCRQISIDLRRRLTREKRSGSEYDLALEELAECVPAGADSQPSPELIALTEALDRFLEALPREARITFLQRYFWLLTSAEIARERGGTAGQVKMRNHRTRKKLREYLEKEGFTI